MERPKGKVKQKIINTQELLAYMKEHIVTLRAPITTKIYVIDNRDYSTMLLAEEH